MFGSGRKSSNLSISKSPNSAVGKMLLPRGRVSGVRTQCEEPGPSFDLGAILNLVADDSVLHETLTIDSEAVIFVISNNTFKTIKFWQK